MSPRSLSDPLVRPCPVLSTDDRVADALRALLDSGLPGLPVEGRDGGFCGIFGEREFLGALFPKYLDQLPSANFVPRSLEETLEKRSTCLTEPIRDHMTTDHVEVGADFSDAQVAETFLHHRVLVLPVVEAGRVAGVITRSDFFRALAQRVTAG